MKKKTDQEVPQSKSKSSFTFKEDFIQIQSNPKLYSKEEEQHDIFEEDNEEFSPREDHESESPRQLKLLEKSSNPKLTKGTSEELKLEDPVTYQPLSPQFTSSRPAGKLSLLEDLLMNRRTVSVKGLTPHNIAALKRWIHNYNSRHRDTFLKLYPDQQRYIIYKHYKYEKDNSPRFHISSFNSPTNELASRNLLRFTGKKSEQPFSFGKYIEKNNNTTNNTSEDNGDASDEDNLSVNSQEKLSNRSGSLDVNVHMMKRGSTYHNLSEKLEMSDEVESITLPEGEEDTSLEFLQQSGNSISEQTIEEDEDEDVTQNTLHLPFGEKSQDPPLFLYCPKNL